MYFGDCGLHLLHDDTFRRLCRARDLLAARFQQPIALQDAAREACFSPFHFHRSFTAAFGATPHEFVTQRRIDLARRLLASGEISVTEVCVEAGYSSLGSFSAKFHRMVGRSPSDYQREVRRVFAFSAPWRIVFVPACFLSRFAGL
jgi:AraC-like DNA-binding protein